MVVLLLSVFLKYGVARYRDGIYNNFVSDGMNEEIGKNDDINMMIWWARRWGVSEWVHLGVVVDMWACAAIKCDASLHRSTRWKMVHHKLSGALFFTIILCFACSISAWCIFHLIGGSGKLKHIKCNSPNAKAMLISSKTCTSSWGDV